MPIPDEKRLRTAEAATRARLAKDGSSGDPLKRRKVRKRLRRLQRKRRRLAVEAKRVAKPAAAAAPGQEAAQTG